MVTMHEPALALPNLKIWRPFKYAVTIGLSTHCPIIFSIYVKAACRVSLRFTKIIRYGLCYQTFFFKNLAQMYYEVCKYNFPPI